MKNFSLTKHNLSPLTFPFSPLRIILSPFPSNLSPQKGFIALSTILLLSAVMLLLVTTASLTSIGEMQESAGVRKGEEELQFVEGCAEDFLMKINVNPNYTGGSINRPEGTCSIIINSGNPNWDITVSSNHTKYKRTIRLTFTRSGSKINIINWKEI